MRKQEISIHRKGMSGTMLSVTALIFMLFLAGGWYFYTQPLKTENGTKFVKKIIPADSGQSIVAIKSKPAIVTAETPKAKIKAYKKSGVSAYHAHRKLINRQNLVVSNLKTADVDSASKDDTPFNEMVVMAMASPENKKAAIKDSANSQVSGYEYVYPQAGWAGFKRYLHDNAISPDSKTGTVELLLSINDQGTITGIKVLKSVSDKTDQKAIDLVNNGPKWVGAHSGKDESISVNVIFDK